MSDEKNTPVSLSAGGLIDAHAVGELLGVPSSTVYEWTRSGRLPVLRLGPRALRWTRPMLEAWLADQLDEGRQR